LASDLDKTAEAYQYFMQAAMVDLEDVRGQCCDGIHGALLAVMAGSGFGFGG